MPKRQYKTTHKRSNSSKHAHYFFRQYGYSGIWHHSDVGHFQARSSPYHLRVATPCMVFSSFRKKRVCSVQQFYFSGKLSRQRYRSPDCTLQTTIPADIEHKNKNCTSVKGTRTTAYANSAPRLHENLILSFARPMIATFCFTGLMVVLAAEPPHSRTFPRISA